MKLFLLLFPMMLAAQPRIGWIEVFGARKVAAGKVEKALGVRVGDPLPPSKGDLEVRLEDVPGVVRAQVEGFCCEDGKAVLYVGIEERGGRSFQIRPEPDQPVTLPPDIVEAYREFATAVAEAAKRGPVQEDLTAGHSMMADAACRMLQERMAGLAERSEGELRKVLRDGEDPEQREIAAYVIGYAPHKGQVIGDLQFALQDPNEGVRRNATRALKAIAVHASQHPELKWRIEPTWFVEMLNSTSFSDRLEGANALLLFTDKPTEPVIANIRDRAMPALYEMAQWSYLGHALPAYVLLGRVSGKDDKEMQDAWSRGERDYVVQSLRKTQK